MDINNGEILSMVSLPDFDLNKREILIFAPLLIITITMGVFPGPFLEIIEVSVSHLIQEHKASMAAHEALSILGR